MQKSSYEVEVLVNGKPLKEYMDASKVYVEGREGTTFSLRMRNNSGARKLFIPSIDGLSVMNGEEASYDSSGYIIRPYSSITIDGWRISDSEVAQFYFSAPNDSYRKRMERGNNLGVIGVLVFSEKEKPMPVVEHHHYHGHICDRRWCWFCYRFHCRCQSCFPIFDTYTTTGTAQLTSDCTTLTMSSSIMNLSAKDSSSQTLNCAFASSVSQDLGTGWGESKKSEVVSVEFERSDYPDAKFEIYYNTREQLKKMGVNLKREPIYVTPNAFPGQYCKPPQN